LIYCIYICAEDQPQPAASKQELPAAAPVPEPPFVINFNKIFNGIHPIDPSDDKPEDNEEFDVTVEDQLLKKETYD